MKLGSVLKAGIAVVVIVAIVGLLFGTEIGRKFLGVLEIGAKKIISGLASLLKLQKKPENFLHMTLSADKESFLGQTFKVTGSSSSIKGICIEVKLNDVAVDVVECEINFVNGNGTVKYQNETVQGSLAVSRVVINKLPFKQAKLEFEIMPTEFSFGGISEKEISISVKNGKLELFNPDGTTKCIIFLKDKVTKIYEFTGSLGLKEGNMYLDGTAYFEKEIC